MGAKVSKKLIASAQFFIWAFSFFEVLRKEVFHSKEKEIDVSNAIIISYKLIYSAI